MIPKIIHQIYFNLHKKEIEEIPLFKKSSEKVQELHPDYKYILWTEEACDNLVKEKLPNYYDFYKSMRYDIQRIDYMRFVILYIYGGIYSDLDLIPIQKFDKVLNQPFFTNTIRGLVPDHCEFVQNDFMGSVRGFKLWSIILNNCEKNYRKKASMEVYNVRTARFVLHTTGPRYLSKIMKKIMPNYKPDKKLIYTKYRNDNWKKVNREDYLVENYVAGSWFETMSNNKASKNFYLKEDEL
tara:strand:- start:1044 stop:1763 length:720 start_codon:yes stop_codon:yes gene_type:complete